MNEFKRIQNAVHQKNAVLLLLLFLVFTFMFSGLFSGVDFNHSLCKHSVPVSTTEVSQLSKAIALTQSPLTPNVMKHIIYHCNKSKDYYFHEAQ